MGGLDEILVDTSSLPSAKQPSKTLPSKQPTTSKSTDGNKNKPAKEEKMFFDPKRIFSPRPKPNPTNNQKKKTELLNNGKPKQSHSKCGIEKSNTSSFINNDLSHDLKQTNCDNHQKNHMPDSGDTFVKTEQTPTTKPNNVNESKIYRRQYEKKSASSRKFDRHRGSGYIFNKQDSMYRKIRKSKSDNIQAMLRKLYCCYHLHWQIL